MNRFLAPALVLATILAAQGALAGANQPPMVTDVAFSGGTERVVLLSPQQSKATLILFPGGDGAIELGPDGRIGAPGDFLVRSRNQWVERGYAVLLPDIPAGSSTLMGRRLSDNYAAAVAALVNFARQESHAPIWLIGTSQGTNAVVNAASRMTQGEIAGIVLTSSLTRPGEANDLRETVFDANLAAIDVPALIVSHADDTCFLSPPADGHKLRAALSRSPQTEAILVTGSKSPALNPCEPEAPHGFYGVEADAINRVASWIAAH